MKRCFYLFLFLALSVSGILVFKAWSATTANAQELSFYYPATGTIVGFDEETDTVFVKANGGHIWSFPEIDDWEIGDNCCMVFCDNSTVDITDDTIVSVRYFA